jgi:hypothetical protein
MMHLRRLGHASSAAEVIRELESLRPSLGPRLRLSQLALPSLTALAEAHLRERLEPAHDPLTGLLDAPAFAELWRAHARHASGAGDDREAIAVAVSLSSAGDLAPDQHAMHLKTLASLCTQGVAENDYVGRTGMKTIAVLPRSGGLRGAAIVAKRLAGSCAAAFADAVTPLRIEVELRDLAGGVREQWQLSAGPQS